MRVVSRRVFVLVLFCVLSGIAGCGHVAGNYPEHVKSTAPVLPEEFTGHFGPGRLVWRDEGVLHGFVIMWKTSADVEQLFIKAGNAGVRNALRDSKHFARMAEDGHCCALVRLFTMPGFERVVKKGDIEVTFADGSTARDVGVLLYSGVDTAKPPAKSFAASVRLSSESKYKVVGRSLWVFVPAECEGKRIRSIGWV